MFLFILILAVGFLYYFYQRYRTKNFPPYIDGALPILGHSILVLTSKNLFSFISRTLNNCLERKIELVTLRLGIWDIHIVLNPEDAVLIANSCLEKDAIYNFGKPFVGEGLLTAPVSKWKVHRKLLNPTFNQQVLDGYLIEFNNQTRDLLDTVAAQAGKGPFNHTEAMVQAILHIICATSMGCGKEDVQSREMFSEVLQRYFLVMTERIEKFWLHSDLIFYLTGRQKQMEKLIDKMHVFTNTILAKKRAEILLKRIQNIDSSSKTRLKPFIELLLELSEEGSLTDREITDELNTFIGAGSDTMAVTLSNALSCIGNYSAVQDRIYEELQEAFKGSDRDVEKQDLPKLKYLEAVIKETLRMHPPAPLIGRILEKEIKIKGYTLPAGSKCYFGVYGILRHWSWGADAHQFRPERWLDGSLPDNMKGFAAFGIGKRNCIGYNFAIMGLKTIIANFLRRYSIKSDISNMVQEFTVTTKPISGHEISIEKRHFSTNLKVGQQS